MQHNGNWESREAYTNADQLRFRSIGETIGTETPAEEEGGAPTYS